MLQKLNNALTKVSQRVYIFVIIAVIASKARLVRAFCISAPLDVPAVFSQPRRPMSNPVKRRTRAARVLRSLTIIRKQYRICRRHAARWDGACTTMRLTWALIDQ